MWISKKKLILVLLLLNILLNVSEQKINLISNPYFLINTCPQSRTICYQPVHSFSVQNWLPDPQIQIGYGRFYNTNLNWTQRVVDLVTDRNTCIKQIISNLQIGSYQLYFQWAANRQTIIQDSKFNLSVNNIQLIIITPRNFNKNSTKIQIPILSNNSQIQIKFCSLNSKSNYGALLIFVGLYKNIIHKEQFLILPSSFDKITTKQFNMPTGGNYTLKFVQKTLYFSENQGFNIKVLWNESQISKLYPTKQSKNIHRFQVQALNGINTLKFDSSHIQGQIRHQILISHIFLQLNTNTIV